MMLAGFIALMPSPLKKIEPESVKAITVTKTEKKPIPATTVSTEKVIAPTSHKQFNPKDPKTWPSCHSNEWVWASDGKCHKRPAQKRSVAHTRSTAVSLSKTAMMAAAGISSSDYSAVDYIVSHESGWRYFIRNHEGSGAYGLCQALPAYKMAISGSDYLTNPVTQLKWCNSYAKSRYGGWWSAYYYWINHHNW